MTELRVEPTEDSIGIGTLRGHAAVFGVMSEEICGFREIVEPGAFRQSIGRDDVRALFNHDPSSVLGRNKAGTLRLTEDRVGLAMEVDLPDTTVGRDLRVSVERGDVTQMSFGFRVIEDIWERKTEDGVEQEVRRLRQVQLFDVSPATFPAYPQTDLALRSLEAWRAEQAGPPATPRLDAIALRVPELRRREARGAVGSHETQTSDGAWSRPTLGEFTSDAWDDLTRDEQRRIVNHAAGYNRTWPETFNDIHLWHHAPARSGQGPLVRRGLFAAAARFNQVEGVDEATRRGMARHLIAHYRQVDADPPEALTEAAGA